MPVALSPAILRSRKKKARSYLDAGQWNDAHKLLTEICSADSKDEESWFLLGAISGKSGDMEGAISHTRRALAIRPDFKAAWYNLAQAQMHTRQYPAAVESYRAYLKLSPADADAHNALGLALDSLGQHDQSIGCYQEATRLNPGLADAWHNAGNASLAVGDRDGGVRYLRHAIFLRPDYVKSQLCLGFALAMGESLDEASEIFEKARSMDSEQSGSIFGAAFVLERRGQFEQAWQKVKPYYEAGCRDERFLLVFAKIARHVDLQSSAASLLEQALHEGSIASCDAREAHFSLGKLYDDLREYDRAFPHFLRANELKNTSGIRDQLLDSMDEIRSTQTSDFFANAPRATVQTERPIFIVGMPRSGTTLTEQILASHPLVAGGGELSDIGAIQDWIEKETPLNASFPVRGSVEQMNVGANRYLTRLLKVSPEAKHVTDKMPHNFVHLGLIALLFPKAKIVHCHRNPMDNCLSIFTYDFNAAHPYAADLKRLGMHYRGYQSLMEHWREHLPLPIFDLRYEDMVAEQEATSRALLDFCGLPWDERCLQFHKSKRIVGTFSYNQVRQPIYKKSVERWRKYESHLGPLRAALEGS